MSVVFDEVIADVSAPMRQTTQETAPSEESSQRIEVKRDVIQTIERSKRREQRLKAD